MIETGIITDPDGNSREISTINTSINHNTGEGLFESYCYKYTITKNGTYTFKYEGANGKVGEITVKIDSSNPIIISRDSKFDSTKFALMQGVGNYIDFTEAKINNIRYKDISIPKVESMDASSAIFNGILELDRELVFEGKKLDAEVVIIYNGKEYKTKNSICLINN